MRTVVFLPKYQDITMVPFLTKVPWERDSKKCYLSSRLNEGLLSIQMLPTFLHFLLAFLSEEI